MVHRGSSIDGGGTFIADARVLQSEFFKEKGYLVGTRDLATRNSAEGLNELQRSSVALWVNIEYNVVGQRC